MNNDDDDDNDSVRRCAQVARKINVVMVADEHVCARVSVAIMFHTAVRNEEN